MNDLRTELAELRLRNEALEAEKNSWMAYIESQSTEGGELQFDSPEDLARAFARERLEKASAIERLGALQPELIVKEDNIRALEDQKAQLQAEISKLKSTGTGSSTDDKAKARLERQRNLAVKESEYLRAQLKALDAEEREENPDRYSESQSNRVAELESLADQYRKEAENLHANLTKLEAQSTPAVAGTKRPLDDDSDERIGVLLRKNRQMQEAYTTLKTKASVLESDLKAKSSQLDTLRANSRTRVLEFKQNPTATATAIKQSMLDALSAENSALQAQLDGRLPLAGAGAKSDNDNQLVPRASLTKLQLSLAEKDAVIASRDKSLTRLREIFRAKGLEFKEAVYSLLGWQLAFQPNGKVKASSMFYKPANSAAATADGGEEEEHFIEFDGENGTMKVSGGPQSEFAREIRGLIEFWVDGKGQVPCFLAAMTLEFWEKYGDGRRSQGLARR
jgi:mitotic spindle assembly checkpoint protein MAD1